MTPTQITLITLILCLLTFVCVKITKEIIFFKKAQAHLDKTKKKIESINKEISNFSISELFARVIKGEITKEEYQKLYSEHIAKIEKAFKEVDELQDYFKKNYKPKL